MIASRVTTLTKEEGAKVDGVSDPDRLERNYALLCLTVAVSIAPIMWKWSDKGKGTKKWRKILVIVEGKMSLSRVAESLCTSMIER